MDIEINHPVIIALDVIDLDDHIPSINFNVVIKVHKFSYDLVVNSNLWIECKCLDEFIENMRYGNIAHLKGMRGGFELIINSSQNYLEWVCEKEDLEGNIAESKGREKLNDDSMASIYEAFNAYPKWW